ncbi:MAG: hypothetical protein M3P50_06690 [Actinomycetota bacterium]|nr:hypothetical protein [Actinomycetota bacterium]
MGKRLLALSLCACAAMVLAACGGTGAGDVEEKIRTELPQRYGKEAVVDEVTCEMAGETRATCQISLKGIDFPIEAEAQIEPKSGKIQWAAALPEPGE